MAGQPTLLQYSLVDAETGLPVTNLEPYLAAWGHTVALHEDATDFVHSHATKPVPAGFDRAPVPSDPRIDFGTVFARPGPHRVWSQVQRNDEVVNRSFTFIVSRLDRLARWDGTDWSSLPAGAASGLDGPARALAANGSDVYLGGDFTQVGGVPASRVARWDGHRWSALGEGVDGPVWSIAVAGGDVYVGGEFTSAGGRNASGVALLGWPQVVSPRFGDQRRPGRFHRARCLCPGGARPRGLCRRPFRHGGRSSRQWNRAVRIGRTWTALGGGVRTGMYDGVVRALAVRGEDLYAGGQFATAGGAEAYNIARWDGQQWSALGSGIRGHLENVMAIGVAGSDVYVGACSPTPAGCGLPNIAKWDGPVGRRRRFRLTTGCWTIAVSGRSVYAGGASFRLPDGAAARGIVRWDGGTWSGLGRGVGTRWYAGPIMAISPSGGKVYVGGDAFTFPDARDLTAKRAAQNAR